MTNAQEDKPTETVSVAPWSRGEALLVAFRFLSEWRRWLEEWGASIHVCRESGADDYPPFTYRMIGGTLAHAHFGCRFRIWPTGRLGTGYVDAEVVVISSTTDSELVRFFYNGSQNLWTKTGEGLRGFPCAWGDPPEFPIQTIGAWTNVLAHQSFCTCGALLVRSTEGSKCPTPDAPLHRPPTAPRAPLPPSD